MSGQHPRLLQSKTLLRDVHPAVWRRVGLADGLSTAELHRVLADRSFAGYQPEAPISTAIGESEAASGDSLQAGRHDPQSMLGFGRINLAALLSEGS